MKTKSAIYRAAGETLAREWRATYGGRGTTLLVRALLVEVRLHGIEQRAIAATLPERMALIEQRTDSVRRLEKVKLSPALPGEHLATLLKAHPPAMLPAILREAFEANIILTKGEKRQKISHRDTESTENQRDAGPK